MISTLTELARLIDPYILGAVLACAACAISLVAALRALPGRPDQVVERLSTPPRRVGGVGASFWTYRATEARD